MNGKRRESVSWVSTILYVTFIFLLLSGSISNAASWLVFTEIHYQPLQGSKLEFIELHNPEPPHQNLTGWRITGEIKYEFPRNAQIRTGECLVVAADPAAFSKVYPGIKNLFGPFSGKLKNSGGKIVLRNPARAAAAEAEYGIGESWTPIPQGTGHSLEISDPFLDPTDPSSWIAASCPRPKTMVINRQISA